MSVKLRSMTSLYLTRGDEILLLYRVGSRVVAPSWCGIGGHFEKDELDDPLSCVLREVGEEIGLFVGDMEGLALRYITSRMKNGEIRQNYYLFAKLTEATQIRTDCPEGQLEWVNVSEILEREMPFTAKDVLRHYLEIGRYDGRVYAGCALESGTVFSPLEEF